MEDVSTPIRGSAIQADPGGWKTPENATSNQQGSSAQMLRQREASGVQDTGHPRRARAQRVQLAVNRLQLTRGGTFEPQVHDGRGVDELPVIQIAVTSNLSPGDLAEALDVQAVPDLTQLEGRGGRSPSSAPSVTASRSRPTMKRSPTSASLVLTLSTRSTSTACCCPRAPSPKTVRLLAVLTGRAHRDARRARRPAAHRCGERRDHDD